MTTIEKELANAYGEVIDAEIEATLASAEPDMPELSPEFRKKMEELIRTGKPNNKKGLSKRGKRILLIAIAAVLALTLTACAVAEWESIAGFFVKIFSDHVEYSDPNVTKERIEEEYGLVPIPEGFSVASYAGLYASVQTQYFSEEFGTIQLVQGAKGAINSLVDNEHGSFSEYSIGGKTVRIYSSDLGASASWVENGYYFILSCDSPVELGVFESWIERIHIIS